MRVIKNKFITIGLFAVSLGVIALIGLLQPQNVSANGVGGGGGGGTCTGNCSFGTANGFGFYRFDVNGSGPGSFDAGTGDWPSASAKCRAGGNDSVLAFIWQRSDRDPARAQVRDYDASKSYNNDSQWSRDMGYYLGHTGGNWRTYEFVKQVFDDMDPDLRRGYTWGDNVAWLCYNMSSRWTIQGESYLGLRGQTLNRDRQVDISVQPGQEIEFKHDLRVRGGNLDRELTSVVSGAGGGARHFSGQLQPPLTADSNTTRKTTKPVKQNGELIIGHGTQSGYNPSWMTYTVQQSDVGRNLCQWIEWSPAAHNNNNPAASTRRCANVPYNYQLTPEISNIIDDSITESAAGTIPITGRVSNSGATKSHDNIQWQITQVKYRAGAAMNNQGGGIGAANPCAYFSGNLQCNNLSSGTEAGGYGNRATATYDTNGTVGDEPVGTRLCYAMSVKRNSSSNTDWRHSQLYCMIVGKKPKVQVLGGDLVVGRGSESNPAQDAAVRTSVSRTASGSYYGSWSEYGVTPSGLVTGMASGAGFASGASTDSLCALSVLTFANAGASGSCNGSIVGGYTHASVAPSIASRFPVSATTPTVGGTVNLSSVTTSGLYTTASPTLAIVGGSQIQAGRWVVIHAPNTTVTIGGDIRYTNAPLNSIQDIPQVVIIARNIIVADSVDQIDAWLVATGSGTEGRINTCGAGGVSEATTLTSNLCDKQLTVNGPISANHLIMRRTAGAGPSTSAGDPAEVFNLRADAYIWASNYTPGTGRIQTVMTTELPPRF